MGIIFRNHISAGATPVCSLSLSAHVRGRFSETNGRRCNTPAVCYITGRLSPHHKTRGLEIELQSELHLPRSLRPGDMAEVRVARWIQRSANDRRPRIKRSISGSTAECPNRMVKRVQSFPAEFQPLVLSNQEA